MKPYIPQNHYSHYARHMAYFAKVFTIRDVHMQDSAPNYKFFWTVIVFGFMALTSLLSGCALLYQDLKPPTLELIAIQPEGIQDNLSLIVLTRLRINNPNSVALPIEGGHLDIGLNGEPVANTTLAEDFTIPANSSADIDIRVNVNLAAGLAIGLSILNDQQADIAWQLNGYVDVGIQYLGRVKIEEHGKIQLGTKAATGI